MEKLQLVSFEIINKCNMSGAHGWCPSNNPERYADADGIPCGDADFLRFLDCMVMEGFGGAVAFHYYCEPTLDLPRCKRIADGVHARGLKTLLWTNGTGSDYPENVFDVVKATDYTTDNLKLNGMSFEYDDRLQIYDAVPVENYLPCYRPSKLEMPVNYYGDVRLCCGDWKGSVKIGNIRRDKHKNIIMRWKAAGKMAETFGFDICHKCRGLEKSPILNKENYKL